jgi:N,N'-diacetyllegionaminate synthase
LKLKNKMLKKIKIGKYTVGEGQPVFIIAEAGVNHNGKLALDKKLVDAAKSAGADAVKFQTFDAKELVTSSAGMAAYQKRNTGKSEEQLKMLERLELSADDFKVLADYCKKKGIIFLSTPHSGFGSVDILRMLNVDAYKFGSADINNFPVLEYAARLKKPIIISSGMASEADMGAAVAAIRKAGNNDIVIFQCTTDYPSKPADANLRVIPEFAKKFNVVAGYSDHTTGTQASIVAVALGAHVLEKHLTLSNEMEGPDHKASENPANFKIYVKAVRDAEAMLGSGKKVISESAKQYIPLVFKSLVVRGVVKKGELFTKANLTIKRPGTGLAPKFYVQVLGTKATRDLVHDELIKKGDFKK